MTELIKLVDKNFFDKKNLNEAGIDPNKVWQEKLKNELADPALNQPTAEEWNKLYNKYFNEKAPNYSIIKVTDLVRKTDKNTKESGYLKYEENTGKSKVLKKDIIESGKLEVVDEQDQATIFTPEEAQSFIKAVKRNSDFDLRETAFAPENIPASTLAASTAAGTILKAFFNKLCGVRDESASNWIRNAMNLLVGVCNGRTYPLVGNPILDVLANAFNVIQIRNVFKPDNININKLVNLLAEREVSVATLKSLNTFKAILFFNNNLYKYTLEQIQNLFDYYEKAWSLKADDIGNEELRTLCEKDPHQIAKHLLMIQGDNVDQDAFQQIVFNTARDTGDILPFEALGTKVDSNDGNLLKWPIRSPEAVKLLFDRINERGESESDSNKNMYLQIWNGDNVETKRSSGEIDGEGADAIFSNVSLAKDNKLRLVYTFDSNRESGRTDNLFKGNLKNILARNGLDKYFKVNDDSSLLVLTDIENCKIEATLDVEAAYGKGNTYKLQNLFVDFTAEPEETETEEGSVEEAPIFDMETETIPAGYQEVDPDGNTNGEVQENVSVQVGDKVVGLDGKRLDVTAENIGPDAKWNIKAGTKIWRKIPETTTTSSEQLKIAGKTLDELAKMTREDFVNWKNSLNDEDKKQLQEIGRRLMTFATAK